MKAKQCECHVHPCYDRRDVSKFPILPFQTAPQASAMKRVWRNSSVVISPGTPLRWGAFPAVETSAAMHINVDELIRLIHLHQTLPFSTNKSSRSALSLRSSRNNRRRHLPLFVQKLPDQEGHFQNGAERTNSWNNLHGSTGSPALSSRRRRRLTAARAPGAPWL